MDNQNKKVITKNTVQRLISDVTEIIKNPLSDQGIYYIHDEDDMFKGYAMIIGPSDTIYAYGYYFFEFTFPFDYPLTPPTVKYLTNDGKTRFHPNLYRNGKVCLSILNTWKGESWTSCQTINSVLLTMVTLFHNKSFLNEPGINETHEDFENYHKIIEFKVIDTAIINIINNKYLPTNLTAFVPIILELFKKNANLIIKKINDLDEKYKDDEEILSCSFYNMTVIINYKDILRDLTELYNLYK